MDTWLRIAIFAVIIISFLRRIFKARTQGQIPSPSTQVGIPKTMTRPRQGRKNDFRDVPPPPENPDLG